MEAPVAVEENDEHRIEESSGENINSPSSSNQIADLIVYKLVRVEGDGRLVPATEDEVMEAEDLLEDEKSDLSLVVDTGEAEEHLCNGGITSLEINLGGSEGSAQSEKKAVNAEKLNARLEYIGVMLQKVKQEEKLRLSCESPDSSSYFMNLDANYLDQHGKCSSSNRKLQSERTSLEILPLASINLNNSDADELGSREGSTNNGCSASAISSGLNSEFSILKREICLENLTVRELHETFKATFGRETSVKDKLWLKRRITMGLASSGDVSTTPFIIREKTLVRGKESRKVTDGTQHIGHVLMKDNSKESRCCPSNQVEDRKLVSGKRLRKPAVKYDCRIEGNSKTEERAIKRVRRSTRRYIEELSEV